MNNLVPIGILFAAAGFLVAAVALISARIAGHRRQQTFGADEPAIPVNLASVSDAVIAARVGGQVTFANDAARRWFELGGSDPDLWLLAQRADPPSAFLELFATEGQAAFTVGGRRVEATSHHVMLGDSAQFVVVLREETPLPALAREERGSGRALRVLGEITQALNASLSVDSTVEAALDGLQLLMPYDHAQICLWDPKREVLRVAGRSGPPDYLAALRDDVIYRRDDGYPGWMARRRQPLLVEDTQYGDAPPPDPADPPLRSYLGAPLMVNNRFIGTVGLGAADPARFDREDEALLVLVAEQAAIAIENARQFSNQSARVEELSGLQRIAEAISELQDPRQLYARLGQRVAELTGTEMAGVLLYDPEKDQLVAQRPFFGIVDGVAARYVVPLRRGSPARSLWESVTYWFSNAVTDDHVVHDSGLADLAEMAGLTATAMATMTVGEERIGLLQIANKRDGSPFTMQDIRLLQTYAHQAAIVVESARLYGQEQSRVAELHGLQQIMQTMSAFTNPEELYAQLTQRIGELLRVEMCGILIHDEDEGMLRARTPFYGLPAAIAERYAINVRRRGLAREVWREHELYVSNQAFGDETIDLMGLRNVVREGGVRTVMLAPLSAGGRRFGMLHVSNKLEGTDFDDDDKRLLSIFAGQAAALIENARLYQDTDETLRKRAAELRSVSRVSQELNTTIELERTLEVIAVEAQRAEGARWGSLALFDWNADHSDIIAHMRFGSKIGGEDARLLERAAARSKETLLIEDFEKVPHYPSPIETARSALLVPVLFEGDAVGVIALYGDRPGALGTSAAEFVQALASQATIAVTNATRHAEQLERSELLRRRAEQMSQIFELGRAFRSDQSLESNLTSVARAVAESVGFGRVLIGVRDDDGSTLHYRAQDGLLPDEFAVMAGEAIPWAAVEEGFEPRFRQSVSYLVPAGEVPELNDALNLPESIWPDIGATDAPDRWHLGDILLVPLHAPGGETLGVLIVDQPSGSTRPDRDALELLEIFANQAAVTVDNSRLYHSVEERAEELSRSLKSLEQSYAELDSLSQEMIRKDIELSQVNELLNTRAARLLSLHRIMESLDTTQPPAAVLSDIASALVEEMDIDQCIIALNDVEGEPRLAASAGHVPDDTTLAGVLAGSNPISELCRGADAAALYTPDVRAASAETLLADTLGARTYCLQPLELGDRRGAILVGSTLPGAGFGDDDRDLFSLLASQIEVEFENAQLYGAVQEEAAAAASDRDRLQQLHLITTALQQSRTLDERLAIIARGLRSVGWQRVAVMMLGKDHGIAHLFTEGYTEDEEATLSDSLLPGEVWAHRFDDPEFMALQRSATYYLPHDHPWVHKTLPVVAVASAQSGAVPDGAWHPVDQIYLPMYAGTDVIGVINLRNPASGEVPGLGELRPIELFVQQAASALENTRLYQETLALQSYNEAVVRSIQQGIVVTAQDGTIESINDFMQERYGWEADLRGRHLFDARPALRALGLAADFEQVLANGEPVERTALQLPVEGEQRHLNVYLYPRFDDQNAVTGVVLLMEDTTQRARLEADIARRGEQLAALNDVSREITSSLSVEAVVAGALKQAGRVMAFDRATLWLRDPSDEGILRRMGAEGRGTGKLSRTIRLRDDATLSRIASTGEAIAESDRADGAGLRSWLGVPMVSGGRTAGVLIFEKAEAHAYAPADVQVAAALANQIAVALENARLFEQAADRAEALHSRTQRLALLNRISATLGSSLDQNSILQTAADELRGALGASQASVVMFDYERALGTLIIQSPSNHDGSVNPLTFTLDDNLLIEQLLREKRPIPLEKATTDPLAAPWRAPLAKRDAQSVLVVPLIVGNALIGVILVEHTKAQRPFEPEQIELTQTLTNQVAISVQNAQLFQETVARQRELSILFEAGQVTAASLDLATVLDGAAEYFTRSLSAGGCTISLLEEDGSALVTRVEHVRFSGPRELDDAQRVRRLAAHPNVAAVLKGGTPEVMKPTRSTMAPAEIDWLVQREAVSALALPILSREEVVGLVELWHTGQPYRYDQREIRLANTLTSSLASAIENARLHDQTERRLVELAKINEMSRALTQTISPDDLYRTLQQQLERALGARSLTLARRDARTGRIAFPLVVRDGQVVARSAVERDAAGLYSAVIERNEPLALPRDVAAAVKGLGVTHAERTLRSFLAVPFAAGDHAGVLAVEDFQREGAFREADLRVLGPIAAQVGVSLENARLYGELEQRLSETTTLQEVTRVINSALDLHEIFERVVRELAHAFGYPVIGLFTVEDGALTMQAHHGFSAAEATRVARSGVAKSIVERVSRTGEPQFAAQGGDLPGKPWQGSALAVPIASEDAVAGVLMVAAEPEKPLTVNDMVLMRTFAAQVSAAMTNARLYEQMVRLSTELEQRVEERTRELRDEKERIDTLYRISMELTASLDLDMVLNRAMELVGEAVAADAGALYLVDPTSDLLIHRASMALDASLPPGGRQVDVTRSDGLPGEVMVRRAPVIVSDVREYPGWIDVPGLQAGRSALGVPLVANDEVLGCLLFASKRTGCFRPEQLQLVEAAAHQVAGSINNAELFRMIRDQAERLGVMLRSQQTEAAKSQAILESVADGVMVSDPNGTIILFNAAAERILGLRRSEVLGRQARELSGLYGPGTADWMDVLEAWRDDPATQANQVLTEQIELEERIVSVQISTVRHGRESLGLVSLFRDITREVMADRIKSEFVARVSHELRTPMTSIKGYADLLLMGAAGELTEQQRHFIETVRTNADRLSTLVNDLLDISRIEQGSLDLDMQPVNLGDLLADVSAAFDGRKQEEGRSLPITIELPDDLPVVHGDYERITQAVSNLIGNAYQYTPDDGQVTVVASANGSGVQIDVIDTGIGIPPEDCDHVFERFYRGESHPLVFKTAGTGLGLSIVQQIVELHQGRVWFESEVGAGSTFSLWLPYRPEPSPNFDPEPAREAGG